MLDTRILRDEQVRLSLPYGRRKLGCHIVSHKLKLTTGGLLVLSSALSLTLALYKITLARFAVSFVTHCLTFDQQHDIFLNGPSLVPELDKNHRRRVPSPRSLLARPFF